MKPSHLALGLGILGAAVALLALPHASASFFAAGPNISSDDGATWTPQSVPTGCCTAVHYGGGNWVAVGPVNSFGTPVIATSSSTPTSWTQICPATAANPTTGCPAGPSAQLTGVNYDGTNWVAVGGTGAGDGIIVTSTSLSAWTTPTQSCAPNNCRYMHIANDGNQWIAVNEGPGLFATITGAPTGTWTAGTTGGTCCNQQDIAYGGGWWVVTTIGEIWRSATPGVPSSWTRWITTPFGVTIGGVATDGTNWVAAGSNGKIYTTSSTGASAWTWTATTLTTTGSLGGVAFDGCHWVTMDGAHAYTSTDRVTWTPHTTGGGGVYQIAAKPCPPPTAPTCTASASSVLVGHDATFTTGGGVPNYSWTATSANTTTGTGTSITRNWGTAGTYTISVTDTGYPPMYPAQTATCTITVNNPPHTTCSPATQTVLVGQSATITAGAGVAPYTWAAPAAFTNTTGAGPSFTTMYTTTGTHTVTVSDSGPPVQPQNCTIQVANPPPLLCTGTSATQTGIPAALSASGGTPPYAWSSPGTPATGNGATFWTAFDSDGSKTVTETDQSYFPQTATCTITVTYPPPTCVPNIRFVTVGQGANFTATGGSGTYAWSSPSGGPTSGMGENFTVAHANMGDYVVTVTSAAQTATCHVRVLPPPPPPPPPSAPYPGAPPYQPPPRGNQPPIPAINAQTQMKCDDWVVHFDGSASSDTDGLVTAWSWEFGDGNAASQRTTTHDYGKPGTYPVTLTVRDDTGMSTTMGLDLILRPCDP